MKKISKTNIKKVEHFAANALSKFINKLIIETDHGWALFGRYEIKKTPDGYFTLTDSFDAIKPHRFNKIRNAVSWAILWDKNRIYEANRVHYLDTAIGAMEIERFLHTRLRKSQDTEMYLIQDAKLIESIAKQKQFAYELDKYITQANKSQLRGYENESKRTSREQ